MKATNIDWEETWKLGVWFRSERQQWHVLDIRNGYQVRYEEPIVDYDLETLAECCDEVAFWRFDSMRQANDFVFGMIIQKAIQEHAKPPSK